jgi:signal transduction histidine kinase
VFWRGLKVNITIILVLVLVTGMILIDFVMIISVQSILLKSEISKAHLFISAIENNLTLSSQGEGIVLTSFLEDSFNKMFDESGIYCALILDKERKQIYFAGDCVQFQKELGSKVRESITSGKESSVFSGTTWGVFWKQKQNLILSSPLRKHNRIVAGVGIVFQLEGIYAVLRRTQYVLLIYILINTVFLTLIGFYRLSSVAVKPVHKLLRRTEDYQELNPDKLFTGRQGDEFHQLSKAFTNMIERISNDKKELELTVCSLEKANKNLKQAQQDIIRAEKLASVGRLAAGIAHEIGNPIAIVIGYLELLRQNDIAEEDKQDFIVRTQNEINRINSIIRQLLDISRPSKGEPKVVSVHEIIVDVLNVFRFQSVMSKIHSEVCLDAENDRVMAEPDQLRQIFLNLMMNAADAIVEKHKDGGGEIRIDTEVVFGENIPSRLKITYSDNGVGVPDDHLENIFDPFYTTKEPGKGTGLGLSVCFMIIESMGGNIRAFSQEDKGTQMVIHLPLSIL